MQRDAARLRKESKVALNSNGEISFEAGAGAVADMAAKKMMYNMYKLSNYMILYVITNLVQT